MRCCRRPRTPTDTNETSENGGSQGAPPALQTIPEFNAVAEEGRHLLLRGLDDLQTPKATMDCGPGAQPPPPPPKPPHQTACGPCSGPPPVAHVCAAPAPTPDSATADIMRPRGHPLGPMTGHQRTTARPPPECPLRESSSSGLGGARRGGRGEGDWTQHSHAPLPPSRQPHELQVVGSPTRVRSPSTQEYTRRRTHRPSGGDARGPPTPATRSSVCPRVLSARKPTGAR